MFICYNRKDARYTLGFACSYRLGCYNTPYDFLSVFNRQGCFDTLFSSYDWKEDSTPPADLWSALALPCHPNMILFRLWNTCKLFTMDSIKLVNRDTSLRTQNSFKYLEPSSFQCNSSFLHLFDLGHDCFFTNTHK